MVRPERLVEIPRPLRRLAVLVGTVDPVQVNPHLALNTAERLRAHPHLMVQPFDERLDRYTRFDVKAVNEPEHHFPLRTLSAYARPRPADRSTRSQPAPSGE